MWEYTEWAQIQDGNGLFTGYVNEFLKIKAQSSGWPAGCQSEEQRAAYLREFAEREGVHLDAAKLAELNAVLRHIAVSFSFFVHTYTKNLYRSCC